MGRIDGARRPCHGPGRAQPMLPPDSEGVPPRTSPCDAATRTGEMPYPCGEPHLPFQVKPLSSVLMDDLKVAHKYGGDDGA